VTKALLHGGIGRRAILLALAAMAILLIGVILTPLTRAQTVESPTWWRNIAENLVCDPISDLERGAVCNITPVKLGLDSLGTGSGTVRFKSGASREFPSGYASSKIVINSNQPAQWSIQLRFQGHFNRANPEQRWDPVAKKTLLAGFGLDGSSDCPAAAKIATDVVKKLGRTHRGSINIVSCEWKSQPYSGERFIIINFNTDIVSSTTPPPPGNCTTDLLKGPWRAENVALAKTGHAVTFAVSTGGVGNHDGNQKRYRGEFTTYPAHKRLLGTVPTPMFTKDKAYPVGKDQCLIPMVIDMRDGGVSRSAALIDTKGGAVRFINEQAYFFKDGRYQIYADQIDAQAVAGAPGRWLRGAAPPLALTCTPADFNGRWDRSDGARITIRGAGTDGVGGYASMDENPGDWVQGQHKYVSMRMKSACVYNAKCYASQRTSTNGVRDFKMVETACEIVIDPATKRMTERGTSNSYSYTKAGAGAGAAARKPPLATTPPEPAQPSQAVQALNSEQAAAAKREIQAYEARKKAIADEQVAKEAAYRKALADREALIAENNRRAAEARAKWEASAAACRAGDQSQCAPKL